MKRIATAFASALVAASFALAAPVGATPGAYYQAQLATPAAKAQLVAKGLVWNCAGTDCAANRKSASRDKIVCIALAKQVGELNRFSAGGEALPADELAACNAAA